MQLNCEKFVYSFIFFILFLPYHTQAMNNNPYEAVSQSTPLVAPPVLAMSRDVFHKNHHKAPCTCWAVANDVMNYFSQRTCDYESANKGTLYHSVPLCCVGASACACIAGSCCGGIVPFWMAYGVAGIVSGTHCVCVCSEITRRERINSPSFNFFDQLFERIETEQPDKVNNWLQQYKTSHNEVPLSELKQRACLQFCYAQEFLNKKKNSMIRLINNVVRDQKYYQKYYIGCRSYFTCNWSYTYRYRRILKEEFDTMPSLIITACMQASNLYDFSWSRVNQNKFSKSVERLGAGYGRRHLKAVEALEKATSKQYDQYPLFKVHNSGVLDPITISILETLLENKLLCGKEKPPKIGNQQERRALLSILPNELWWLILSFVSPKDKIFSIGLPNFFATILAANSRKEWVLAKLANLPFKEVETVYLRELEEVEIDNDSDMEFEEIDEEES